MSPWPGFGIRSTVVVAGRRLACSTGMNLPFLESRPSGKVFDLLIFVLLHNKAQSTLWPTLDRSRYET